mgnify:CR=1 FL=1
MEKYIRFPMTKEEAEQLRAGDYVLINGVIYTARDAAHKRMDEAINKNEKMVQIYVCNNPNNTIYSISRRSRTR